MTVVAAVAMGSGPTAPNKRDPTRRSKVEVLVAPIEEARARLDIKDFLRNNFKLIFEAPRIEFRARIKEITGE